MSPTEAEDVLSVAANWCAAGEQVALATVTETWGSSPRPAGSQMAVTKSGKMAGSVSGGCIEGAVAEAALQHHRERRAAAARFRRDERARLGGRARLRRQGEGVRGTPRVNAALLAAMQEARAAQRPIALATRLPDGAQRLLPAGDAPPELNAAAGQAIRDDQSRTVRIGGEDWFLHVHNPPLRLVVVGAVHIAQALVPLAAQLGQAVIVVDPRRSFATGERFPTFRSRLTGRMRRWMRSTRTRAPRS